MDILGLGLLQVNNWLLLLTALLTVAYLYFTWQFDFFTKRGIPGPKPVPFFGTAYGFLTEGIQDVDIANRKKYGKIYGMFEGPRPVLMVHDPEFLKHIFIRNHADFINRRTMAGANKYSELMLSAAKGEYWKSLRSTMSPTFSTGKLKLMTKQINECAQALVENLAQEADTGNHFECKGYSGAFTMDVIAITAFGLKLDSQKQKNDPFVAMGKKAFEAFTTLSPMVFVAFFFPFLVPLSKKLKLNFFPLDVLNFFADVAGKTLDARQKSQEERPDFVQLMMNAHKENQNGDMEHDQEFSELHKNVSKRGLSRDEILAQCILFFTAGYETTAAAISLMMYCMALNPDTQEKLHEEIMDVVGDKEVDYSLLCEMDFLEMCCQETMRLYPPGVRVDRECTRSTTVKGIDIPEGTLIGIPIYAIHHDPEVWPDPEKFDPYRFAPEEKAKHTPYDWIPFGSGPRQCVAMRLALTEFKIAMVYILRNYRLIRGPKTEVPLTTSKAGILTPKNGIWIQIEKR